MFPLVAGFLKFRDVRGPKIYFPSYHMILYRWGYSMRKSDDGKSREPYGKERAWFYGLALPERSETISPTDAIQEIK